MWSFECEPDSCLIYFPPKSKLVVFRSLWHTHPVAFKRWRTHMETSNSLVTHGQITIHEIAGFEHARAPNSRILIIWVPLGGAQLLVRILSNGSSLADDFLFHIPLVSLVLGSHNHRIIICSASDQVSHLFKTHSVAIRSWNLSVNLWPPINK